MHIATGLAVPQGRLSPVSGSLVSRYGTLHPAKVRQKLEPVVSPKCEAALVILKKEDVAFLYLLLCQLRKTLLHKLSTYALASVVLDHSQVMKVASSAVVTTQNHRDDSIAEFSDQAEAWVSIEEPAHGLPLICIAEGDTCSLSPELNDLVIVVYGHSAYDVFHS
jgi:hypothetical protein